VLQEALAKEPRDRPATASVFVRRLRRAFEETESAALQQAARPRRRLLAAAAAALALAAGLLLPDRGLPPAERWLDDLRMEAAAPRNPDPRILLITLDEASLRAGSAPLAGRADEIGAAIDEIFAAGARGVAVNLLLPGQWQGSPAFTGAVLHHPGSLTLAAFSAPDGSVVGTDCASGLVTAALGPERAAALFGFANLDEDPDAVTRTGRLSYRDRLGGERPSWAARAAAALGPLPHLPPGEPFRIDHRIVPRLYPRLSWQHLAAALARHPALFRGRLVLLGSDSPASGDDYHQIPAGPGEKAAVSGLILQALEVDTIAAGLPVRAAPARPAALLAALLAGLAAACILLAHQAGRAAAGLLLAAVAYAAVSVPVFQRTGLLLPVTAPCLAALLALAAALALRGLSRPRKPRPSS
jgi:CHASE2 domain-containing sensor protein